MMADRRAYGCTGYGVAAANLVTGQGTDRCALSGAGWLLVGIVSRLSGDGEAEKHGGQNDTSHGVFLRWGGLNATQGIMFPWRGDHSLLPICLGAVLAIEMGKRRLGGGGRDGG
jgi:hypothetical protein